MDMPQILTEQPGRGIYRSCRARSLIYAAPFDREVQDEVWRYVDGTTAPALTLSKYLASHGIPVSVDAIRRHRRRECACPDPKDNDE